MRNLIYIVILNIILCFMYSDLFAQNIFVNNRYNKHIPFKVSGYLAFTTDYSKQYLKNRNINKAHTLADAGINLDMKYNVFDDMAIGINALFDTKYNRYYWQYDKSILRELYTYIQNKHARLEFGKMYDIAGKMQIYAPDVGLFGANDSHIYSILLIPNYIGSKKFFINSSTNISFLKRRERISIITSNKNKLRFGASYTFPEKNHSLKINNILSQPEINEEISIATKFSTNFMGNSNISLSIGYSKYNNLFIKDFATAKTRKEISSGFGLFIKGITFGASILKIDEIQFNNLMINIPQYSYAGWAYNAGFAFEIGPWGTSISYHGSVADGLLLNPNQDKSHMLLFSMRRNLKKHLTFYTSIAGLMLESENQNMENKGISIAIGTIFKY